MCATAVAFMFQSLLHWCCWLGVNNSQMFDSKCKKNWPVREKSQVV